MKRVVLGRKSRIARGMVTVAALTLSLQTGLIEAAAEAGTGDTSRKAVNGVEAGIDRLAWLGKLEARLKHGKRPPCIGPLGCTVNIPEGSPCRNPVKAEPEVRIDGVVPGVERDTWVVAYRLICSECYEGGDGYLLLLRIDPRDGFQFLDKIALKKGKDEIPKPLQMVQEDVDENGEVEVIVRYRNVREKKRKCTGMSDASGYLLIVRPLTRSLRVLFHEQTSRVPEGRQKALAITYRFDDVNEDGYPDLITTQTMYQKGETKDHAALMVQSVRCYDEGEKAWRGTVYRGFVPVDAGEMTCDFPLPGKPYAVVASLHTERTLSQKTLQPAAKLREAGFEGACVLDAKALGGFATARFVTVVSAHTSRGDAEASRAAARRAGFSPFVKRLFGDE